MKKLNQLDQSNSIQSQGKPDSQNRMNKSKGLTQETQRLGSPKSSISRFEEIDTKTWHLTERLAREHDRTFNNQNRRSSNYVFNQMGTNPFFNAEQENISKIKSKYEHHKDKRTRDFQSNILTLPNPKCSDLKDNTEKIFATSPKHPSIMTIKTGESFYFKAATATLSDHLPDEFKTYQKSIKQFDISNKRRNDARHNLIFHSTNVF
jgi:hypothetical protein